MYNRFIDNNLLQVSIYKRQSGKYTLLTLSRTTALHAYIHHGIIIIAAAICLLTEPDSEEQKIEEPVNKKLESNSAQHCTKEF
jgi:hypothetical protein